MTFIQKTLAAAALALLAASVHAKTAIYNGSEYQLLVKYNEQAQQGDAVFVRMRYSTGAEEQPAAKTTATLRVKDGEKTLASADFYFVGEQSATRAEMLAGAGISSWQKGGGYTIEITYRPSGKSPMRFTLPLTVCEREFEKETLYLDESNTAIRTDTSPKRMEQINRLNGIFDTVDAAGVHQTTRFAKPVESERMTAHCWDRRVYAYSNGKSATSEHFGNDYGVPTGTEVYACADGKVVLAEDRVSTGWSIVIEHLPGLYSVYYHMSRLQVQEGQIVRQGELIGLSGSTGLATGPHLHWEMRLRMAAVRPEFFLGDFAFEE